MICGWTKTINDVAHIIPQRDGGPTTLDNVAILCPNHHRMFDTGKIPQDVLLEAKRRSQLSMIPISTNP